MEIQAIAETNAQRIAPVLDEAQALLAQAAGLKPGVQTTEFWLMAGTSLVITGLAAFGRIEPAIGGILLSANSAIYQTLRQGMKKAVEAAPATAAAAAQPFTPANAAQPVAPASPAQPQASADSLPLASAVSGATAQAAAGKQG